MNSLQLRLAGVPKATINFTNKLYDGVCYATTTKLLDKYASQCMSVANTWKDEVVMHAGDNVDARSKRRHEASTGSTYDLHFYNNLLFRSRLDLSEVSDVAPALPSEFTADHVKLITPSVNDDIQLKQYLEPVVASSWSAVDPAYKDKCVTPSHEFTAAMTTKTQAVSVNNWLLFAD